MYNILAQYFEVYLYLQGYITQFVLQSRENDKAASLIIEMEGKKTKISNFKVSNCVLRDKVMRKHVLFSSYRDFVLFFILFLIGKFDGKG